MNEKKIVKEIDHVLKKKFREISLEIKEEDPGSHRWDWLYMYREGIRFALDEIDKRKEKEYV